mmetsp:Transcript_28637/g.53969  ORF Transcript_28637/g.53969 Transcript_28637/m.53969 type:complete len:387 (+) Transcript_28637:869-2029(+)
MENGMSNITGTNASDFLAGTSGDDTISGLAGNDILRGGLGVDVLTGGSGLDRADYRDSATGVQIEYNTWSNQNNANGYGSGSTANGDVLNSIEAIIGSSHNDTVYGNGGDQFFFKTAGSDYFSGGGGSDKIDYELATDASTGLGVAISIYQHQQTAALVDLSSVSLNFDDTNVDHFLDGYSGLDRDTVIAISDVDGTQNADWIVGSNGTNLLDGHGGNDTINGVSGDDTIYGGAGHDLLNGGWGNDLIRGEDGADQIFGGYVGNDSLYGGNGNDALDGGTGVDRLYGDAGDDVLFGGADLDIDYLNGGTGYDVFVFADDIGADRIRDFEQGVDIIDFAQNSDVSNFADLVMSQAGDHVRINVSSGNIVYVYDTDLVDMDVTDFAFM